MRETGKQKWENGADELWCSSYKTSADIREFCAEMALSSCPELNNETNLHTLYWSVVDSLCLWGEGLTLRHAASFIQKQYLEKNSATSLQLAALPLDKRISTWVLKGRSRQYTKLCITWHSKYFSYCWFIVSLFSRIYSLRQQGSLFLLSIACRTALCTEDRASSHEYLLNNSVYKQRNKFPVSWWENQSLNKLNCLP